jgi:SPP1 gp7 family putative phage head morphogenesis protein
MPVRIAADPGNSPIVEPATPGEFARAFRLRPEEAVRYMRGRDAVRISYDWHELWHDEHARAFTVSRLARADLLQSLRDMLEKSVAGDLSRRDWMRDAKKLLSEAGWWGEKDLIGPDGVTRKTRFNPARLKLIFDVNTRMAWSAGRWQRIQAAKDSHPYLRYVTRADERVRQSHRVWHNVTLPVDHPWWQTHYPPCGWRCRCRAVPMRRAEFDQRQDLQRTPPAEPEVPWTNPRTGEVRMIPARIDPGFGYNVGEAAQRWHALLDVVADKAEGWAASIAGATLSELAASEAFVRWYERPHGAWPLARLPDADAQALGAREGVRVVRMSEETAAKQRQRHPELGPQDYVQAQDVIERYTHKVLDGASMIYVLEVPDGESGGYVLVVKATRTGKALWVTSFRKLHAQEARRDSELRRLLKKGDKG